MREARERSRASLASGGPPNFRAMSSPVYTTPDAVRLEAGGLTADQLSDAAAELLIRKAERLVDAYLGLRGVYTGGPSAGRKVAEADVKPWIWLALGDATAELAAKILEDPARFDRIFGSVSGPQFSTSDPRGSILGASIETTLNGTGLVRRTARGTA